MNEPPPAPASHQPLRPLWVCRIDAYPWPCADARLHLTAEFRGRTLALTLFLATHYVEALGDLHTIDPELGAPPDSRVLYERFLGWVPVRRHE
ncbi:hypothetical protein BDK92_3466 [Micromonospora pisi]|uniref:Flavin reductase (DIM6/NTAB) family NADH-FMN oxidoreductase RutF n=1 Tax=Micromonospora pisi TaxID=589240 RepID=A0A495JKN4_9ACTN|nr:hypothetical protein [Micromonospora pisi]RKR89128.1 hypothetical protein BDK92_3466 [Micromonospora pisi]